ncbi:TenA family protein [Wolbachia endosymbiont (group B) of Ochlodes sylvanus]|uniref:TenA family protein n=1 Tax=Wolbachia endosymbiont (group B) of Ochlodes sylvanus TaxID=2954035 RepID=UPI0022206AC6|nr:TenA family protein [Wolbachia endosymbiont (group B) of Ochlodes sylvanus]
MFSGIIKSYYGSNLLKDIIEHPFNVELANNTLNIENFKFYIQQDAFFLADYVRTVLMIASKMESCNNIVPFIEVAKGVVEIMKVLYNYYFAVYSINRGEKSLECFNFTNFLLSTSYSNVYEAVTVLYSCHFIYKVVVNSMRNKIKKNNRYKDWLDFFGSSLMESGCVALEGIVDEYCNKVRESERTRMLELFKITAQFELDFWNSAYNFSRFNQFPKKY